MAIPFKATAFALAAATCSFAVPASAASTVHYAAPTAVSAQADVYGDLTYEHGKKHKRKNWRHYRGRDHYGDRYDYRDYRDQRPYYMGYGRDYGQPVYRNTRIWRARDGRYYCRKDDGTTGLLVGAGVGALIGHEVAGRGDRTLGALLGGVAGALLGRSIDRSNTRCG